MTRSPRARELTVLGAAIAFLALGAFGLQKLFFPRQVQTPNVARALDDDLGPLMRAQIRATQAVVDSPAVREGFAVIMNRLTAAVPGDPVAVEVLVIDSREVNAFTLPGGLVCVDTGLVRVMESAEQMSGVLAHELSHATSRDPLVKLGRQLGMATVASAVAGGQAGQLVAGMVQTLVDVHYGREAEDRADKVAVTMLARAGVPPASFGEALAVLKDAAAKTPGLLKYFDPHSPIDERIEAASEQARHLGFVPRPLAVDWPALVEALPAE